jgi:hypothetical protein
MGSEPRTVFYMPEPPSILQRIVDIVEAERAIGNDVSDKNTSRLNAYAAIVNALQKSD